MFNFFKRKKDRDKENKELKELNEINKAEELEEPTVEPIDPAESDDVNDVNDIDEFDESDEIEEIYEEESEKSEELEESQEAEETEDTEPEPEPEAVPEKNETSETEKKEKKGLSFFEKLKEGLSKTKKNLTEQIESIVFKHKKIDDEFLEELEEILITSDMGVETTMDIIDYIKTEAKKRKLEDTSEIKDVIKEYLVNMLEEHEDKEETEDKQRVILIVGVNGVGKTTSIGKIAYRLKEAGSSVIVAAADTFRAAAVEQLKEWCTRAGVEIVASEQGSDPGAVVFDAIHAAKARKTDILLCDTAGRLHNKKNLMNELSKIFKIVEREFAEAKIDVYLVIDATTGQNGIIQAKLFAETCSINGLILTKLDGTAKGGIAFPIVNELKIPIKYVGVGEKIDDLQDFNAADFVNAIFE
ncbi:MAG TPA: signal recognition particle-docking protein FtsY [Clostridiales bacterium]|nr:signal recognition particle-docking protein FtsY [Clostridiales bacterium]